MIRQIPEYQSVLSRSKYYKGAYKEMIVQVGKSKRLNEFEKFVLQLTYQINVLFEEDIRVILNILNGSKKNYSLATTTKNLKKYGFVISHSDDVYGKYYSFTAKSERLLNPHINSPSDFRVSDKIERYRIISAYTCVQLTAGLTNDTIHTLILRYNKLSFTRFGLFNELEKSERFFRTIVRNGKSYSILTLEENYTYLIKTKTILYSKRRTCLNQVKKIVQTEGKIVITYEEQEKLRELERIENDIKLLESHMNKLKKQLGQNVKPYNSTKKDTIMTLQYFLQNGILWTIKSNGSAYLCSVIYLDYTRYGNQHKLFEVLYNLSIYLTDRLDTTNFQINLTMFRVDDDKRKEFETYSKYAMRKFKALRTRGDYISGICENTLCDVKDDNLHYQIYNLIDKYAPYKRVVSSRFEEREYKRRYYEQKKIKDKPNGSMPDNRKDG